MTVHIVQKALSTSYIKYKSSCDKNRSLSIKQHLEEIKG